MEVAAGPPPAALREGTDDEDSFDRTVSGAWAGSMLGPKRRGPAREHDPREPVDPGRGAAGRAHQTGEWRHDRLCYHTRAKRPGGPADLHRRARRRVQI